MDINIKCGFNLLYTAESKGVLRTLQGSQNTKPAMETASQLNYLSTPQALVAIPSFIWDGYLLKKLINKYLALKPPTC